MNSREDGFLSRWAKRKADVRETEERKAALEPLPGQHGNPVPASDGQPVVVDEDARDVPPDDETRQRASLTSAQMDALQAAARKRTTG